MKSNQLTLRAVALLALLAGAFFSGLAICYADVAGLNPGVIPTGRPRFKCVTQSTLCCNIPPADVCFASNVFCGDPYNCTCYAEKTLESNAWGLCQQSDPDCCDEYQTMRCAKTQAHDLKDPIFGCVNPRCWVFYSQIPACDPAQN